MTLPTHMRLEKTKYTSIYKRNLQMTKHTTNVLNPYIMYIGTYEIHVHTYHKIRPTPPPFDTQWHSSAIFSR